MTDLRQAAQQALAALAGWSNHGKWVWPESGLEQAKRNTTEAITALEAALAAQQPEPVAWMTFNPVGDEDDIWYENPEGKLLEGWSCKPLYTTPPHRQPLSDGELMALLPDAVRLPQGWRNFARAIEAAHGIGGDK